MWELTPPLSSAIDAVTTIRRDLRSLARSRLRRFAGVLLAAGVACLLVAHGPVRADPPPTVLIPFFFAASTAISVVLGVPLWRRRTVHLLTLVSLASLILGLLAGAGGQATARPPFGHGLSCWLTGTAAACAAYAAVRAASGPLWRRFPDVAVMASVGATGAGLIILSSICRLADPSHLLVCHLGVLAGTLLFILATARGRLASRPPDSRRS